MPTPKALPDNRWEMIWCLELENLYISPDVFDNLAEEISREIRGIMKESFERRHPETDYPVEPDDYVLQFDLINTNELNLVIYTGRYAYTDECWVLAPVWLFMRVEQKIGPIRLIQNEPKEQHLFWRARRGFFGNNCPV